MGQNIKSEKMNKILLFIAILAMSATSFGQSYLNLIEKGKFSKVEKKIFKELEKEPNDIELNYSLSLLFINRGYSGYDAEKSYHAIIKTNELFHRIQDEKVIKKLNKIPINSNEIERMIDTIARNAMEDAIINNKTETYENFLKVYIEIPSKYTEAIIIKRDLVAFQIAVEKNSVVSYQFFIDHYPQAVQIPDAIMKRDELAFNEVKRIDKIDNYKEFINRYPNAKEVSQANERIYEIAYSEAETINTSKSYEDFTSDYPESPQFSKAKELFQTKQFYENTEPNKIESYKLFVENYPNNPWIEVALDSVFEFSKSAEILSGLEFCVKHFTGEKRENALIVLHDLYTNDGEEETLNKFYYRYDDKCLKQIKKKDFELIELSQKLHLEEPYNPSYFIEYDEYIRQAAPREKAFVALQNLISQDIILKDWKSAINKVKTYYEFFGNKTQKLDNLISIMEKKVDNTVKINSIGNSINTVEGGEYVPVITGDEKNLYFCGNSRLDNIGGEDIFYSRKVSGQWTKAELVADLSSTKSNDAPVSISSDGTTMIVFKSGSLYYSEKTGSGWTEIIEYPQNINSGKWQADGMISSDGKALFFASVREENYNIHQTPGNYYHGNSLHQSDIYVSIFDDGKWGKPINLGNVINTPYTDRSPFLHPDMKTLYFSSDGHGGLGKMDVFKSTRLSDTCWNCWSEPINLGKEINTENSEWGYKISTDGKKAYFAKKSTGNEYDDIYWLTLPAFLRPDFVATISGKLIDKEGKPVASEIRWDDLETGKSIGQSKSDPKDGSFFIVLPLGKMYGYYVNHKKYFPVSSNIDLRKTKEAVEIYKEITLVEFKEMVDENKSVQINNLFFNFAESTLLPYSIPELKRVAEIIKTNNYQVEIAGHTDNIGGEEKNQILSEKRAQAVKDFLISEGCDEKKLVIIGYGTKKPVASNDTEAGRAKNRRVELRFIK